MVTATANCTWIKEHIKVATNPITEALSSQVVVVDELANFNDEGHKPACYNAMNPGGGDKGVNVSLITEARLSIAINSAKYYEDAHISMALICELPSGRYALLARRTGMTTGVRPS